MVPYADEPRAMLMPPENRRSESPYRSEYSFAAAPRFNADLMRR